MKSETAAGEIDAAPEMQDDAKKEIAEVPGWCFFFKPQTVTNIMHKKFLLFGAIAFLYYAVQFVCCVAACNFYSDATRNATCTVDGVEKTGADASAIMDTAILLAGIWHIIEWIRTTILLTVILIGVNLMHVWYATAIASVYGFVSFIYLMAVYFGSEAAGCEANQPTRYQWLMVEMIFFFTLFFPFLAPMAIVRCFRREQLQELLNEEEEEEDDKEAEEARKREETKERYQREKTLAAQKENELLKQQSLAQ